MSNHVACIVIVGGRPKDVLGFDLAAALEPFLPGSRMNLEPIGLRSTFLEAWRFTTKFAAPIGRLELVSQQNPGLRFAIVWDDDLDEAENYGHAWLAAGNCVHWMSVPHAEERFSRSTVMGGWILEIVDWVAPETDVDYTFPYEDADVLVRVAL